MTDSRNVYRDYGERPFDSFYMYLEETIEAPVERVWHRALDIGSWMDRSRLETVAGEPGQVGHLVRVHPPSLGSSVPEPHYHLYAISNIVPGRLIGLEVFLEKGGSYGRTREKVSCDTIYLTDIAGRTVVGYYLIDVHFGHGDEEFRVRRRQELDKARPTLVAFLGNLRRLVTGHP